MATYQVVSSLGWGTHLGLVTGNAGNRLFDSVLGTLGTDIQVIAGAAIGGSAFGLRCSGANHGVRWDVNTLGAGRTSLVWSSWFRVSTDPGGLKECFSFELTNGGNDWASLDYDPGTNKLEAWINATNQASTMDILPGEDHYLEFRYNITANPHTLAWSIDGIPQTTVTLAQAADTFTGLLIGDASSGASGAFDYAHIVMSITAADYPLGTHRVVMLSVDPADTVTLSGTAANFSTFTANGTLNATFNATTARNAIDEIPPTIGASADGFVQDTTATGDYVQCPMTTETLAGGESFVAARMLACGWAVSATAGTLGFRSWNGTTETILQAGTVDPNFSNSTTLPAWVAKMLTAADVDSQTKVDALAFRVGFSSNAGVDQGIHAIYADVAIAQGGAPSTNDTASSYVGAHTRVTAAKSVSVTVRCGAGAYTRTSAAKTVTATAAARAAPHTRSAASKTIAGNARTCAGAATRNTATKTVSATAAARAGGASRAAATRTAPATARACAGVHTTTTAVKAATGVTAHSHAGAWSRTEVMPAFTPSLIGLDGSITSGSLDGELTSGSLDGTFTMSGSLDGTFTMSGTLD